MKFGDPIFIEWDDACERNAWVRTMEECKDSPANCCSVGFFILEDSRKLVIANTVADDNMFCTRLVIPKGCIHTIKKLKKGQYIK